LNHGWRLENNFRQLSTVNEAEPANETDRVWDFNEAKSTAVIKSMVQQVCYVGWRFKIESRERRAFHETLCPENSYLTAHKNTFGRAQILNHFVTVSPHKKGISNQKVETVDRAKEMIRQPTRRIDEFD
jgi:hypothetical protein